MFSIGKMKQCFPNASFEGVGAKVPHLRPVCRRGSPWNHSCLGTALEEVINIPDRVLMVSGPSVVVFTILRGNIPHLSIVQVILPGGFLG